ncbi:MAG: hypothetical protein H6740_07535 [Alphaproteobacteria bacterium]|nr:hypothetical protein [Alphaproteobacteria bacterium]
MSDPIQDLLAGFKAETEPPEDLVEEAVRRALSAPPNPWPRRALVAGGALLVGLVAWLLGPTPPPPALALSSPDAPSVLSLGEGVALELQGEGETFAEDGRMVLRWQVGRLSLRGQGASWPIDAITTEGQLSIERGDFTLERDALGSRFRVDTGEARLRCQGQAERALSAGERAECLPVSAAGWRARAQALHEAGQGPEAVLGALDAGLALEGSPEVLRAELEAARVQPLLDAGREAEALAAAERYLEQPGRPRTQALRRVAANVALRAGDCARALPHLQALEAPSVEEQRWLEHCSKETP